MPPLPPTEHEIRKIARRTIDIIVDYFGAKNVCLVGSAAAALWADIKRTPNDVDILVSPDDGEHFDAEEIKESIVNADERYYLRPSKKPGAKYQVLFCRLPGWRMEGRKVKVDIILPLKRTLWIPKVLSRDALLFDGIPITPLFDLLVIKMQGLRDHRASSRLDFLAKVKADIVDIRALLDQAIVEGISYEREKDSHTRGFMIRACRLALGFIGVCGKRAKFRSLGFPV